MSEFRQSEKQTEIMSLLFEAADKNTEIELHELKSKLSYGADVTVQAVLCSLRFLDRYGFITRVRRKRQLYLKPSVLAYKVFRPEPIHI